MKTVIISSENVKPSSPTPHHLQRYQISRLDQRIPPTCVPVILYFSNNDQISFTPELLMRSLSVIITRFYPLAGRINDDGISINCNDQGVPFTVAKAEKGQKISVLLSKPDLNLPRKQLLPCELTWLDELGPGSSVVMIQLTRFDCGGFTIGIVFWHKIMDVATISHFLKCWAHSTSVSGKEPVCPNYILQSLFPLNPEMAVSQGSLHNTRRRGKSMMLRYVFNAHAISTLKSEASNYMDRPSRFEVVSALICRCFMTASLANGKSTTVSSQAVNLRRKACPPFPSDCFGNFIGGATNCCANSTNIGEMAERIRASISKVDGGYLDRILLGDKSSFVEELGLIDLERADFLVFSSWCNFGFYDLDFGWGKPSWIAFPDPAGTDEEWNLYNSATLLDTRTGDGVEAWVSLDEKYMEIFDSVIMEELRVAQGRC